MGAGYIGAEGPRQVNRISLVITAVVLLLAACDSGNKENATPAGMPVAKSRLKSFDAGNLAGDLQIPNFTEYWALAEQRNGNVYPINAKAEDPTNKVVRLTADGAFNELRQGEFHVQSLAGIGSGMERLSQDNWNETEDATGAALILFADERAPYTSLLKLCDAMVDLRVQNLWLVTKDDRDDALRLMPLKVDVQQVFNEWYAMPADEAKLTLRFSWFKQDDWHTVEEATLGWAEAESSPLAVSGDGWRKQLAPKIYASLKAASRVQFDLPLEASVGEFAGVVNLLAPIGYAEIEPFWPALDRKLSSIEVRKERRKLEDFNDALEVAKDITPPVLSEFWRASAADRGLPAAATPDPDRPLLAIRIPADGRFSSRTRDSEWVQHSDDQEVVQAMQRNAGEIDFDSDTSELQVLLCMDRDARWESFLAVLEMMRLAMCGRLLVVTSDVLGPKLRLLDFSLPLGDLPAETPVAEVKVDRTGALNDMNYSVAMLIDGEIRKTTGEGFASTLARWAIERKRDPEVLRLMLPRDEPFQTCFNVLNALAWLGMHSIRIGG